MSQSLDCTSYLQSALCSKNRREAVAWCMRQIRSKKLEFDTIAVRGISGLAVGSILAYRLNVSLAVVRKEASRHSERKLEGWGTANRVLIVDDVIASGGTVHAIYEQFPQATIIGVLLYRDLEWRPDC